MEENYSKRQIVETIGIIISLVLSISSFSYSIIKDREYEKKQNEINLNSEFIGLEKCNDIIIRSSLVNHEFYYSDQYYKISIFNTGQKSFNVYKVFIGLYEVLFNKMYYWNINDKEYIYSYEIFKNGEQVDIPFIINHDDIIVFKMRLFFPIDNYLEKKLKEDLIIKHDYGKYQIFTSGSFNEIEKKYNRRLNGTIMYTDDNTESIEGVYNRETGTIYDKNRKQYQFSITFDNVDPVKVEYKFRRGYDY